MEARSAWHQPRRRRRKIVVEATALQVELLKARAKVQNLKAALSVERGARRQAEQRLKAAEAARRELAEQLRAELDASSAAAASVGGSEGDVASTSRRHAEKVVSRWWRLRQRSAAAKRREPLAAAATSDAAVKAEEPGAEATDTASGAAAGTPAVLVPPPAAPEEEAPAAATGGKAAEPSSGGSCAHIGASAAFLAAWLGLAACWILGLKQELAAKRRELAEAAARLNLLEASLASEVGSRGPHFAPPSSPQPPSASAAASASALRAVDVFDAEGGDEPGDDHSEEDAGDWAPAQEPDAADGGPPNGAAETARAFGMLRDEDVVWEALSEGPTLSASSTVASFEIVDEADFAMARALRLAHDPDADAA
eukprot:TRINITY_DN29088_c0_g1_i1.p1 TRINITY_DN29088_c0_g1~~TRINITY_DN29088_c0_g1_i1.p1  ORF type:complete len:390 (+),score=122.20 TRINITY_DN29088_c0_g1_i1:65-1171(+)